MTDKQTSETINGHKVEMFSLKDQEEAIAKEYMQRKHLTHEEARSLLFHALKKIPGIQKDKIMASLNAVISVGGDALEGAIVGTVTAGTSELVPITEVAVDLATAKIAEASGITVTEADYVIGNMGSLIPVVGDFISPSAIASVRGMIESDAKMLEAYAMIIKAGYNLMKKEDPQLINKKKDPQDQNPVQAMINQQLKVPTSLMNGEQVGTQDKRVPEQVRGNYSAMPQAT